MVGKGTLHNDNGKTKIGNVLYVKDFKHNLLSASQMYVQRCTLIFNSQFCEIRKVNTKRISKISKKIKKYIWSQWKKRRKALYGTDQMKVHHGIEEWAIWNLVI